MKTLIIAILLIATAASCTEMRSVSITARPDPNTSTSGTIGSVKATDGILPLQVYGSPRR
jgi:hypothetical protein